MKTTPFRPVPSGAPSARPRPELSLRPALLPVLVAMFHLLAGARWLVLCDVLGAVVLLRVIFFCRRALQRRMG